jgi:hypothetical protein
LLVDDAEIDEAVGMLTLALGDVGAEGAGAS